MRWPIQFQLLFPMLLVVVLTIALASVVSAYFGGMNARHSEDESLRRVVATLTEARFPLVESVLRQMRGLSGDEFVLLDQRGAIQTSTVQLSPAELERLQDICSDQQSSELVAGPTITLGGHSLFEPACFRGVARSRLACRLIDRSLSQGALVGGDAAGGLSGDYCRCHCRCGRCACHHCVGPSLCSPDSAVEATGSRNRARRFSASAPFSPRRRNPRSCHLHQPDERTTGAV